MELFKKEVKIPEKITNYIELLYYEFECYKDLMHTIMLDNNKYKYNIDIYQQYMTEYKQAKKSYMVAINELKTMYAPETIDLKDITIKVDFNKNMVIFQQGSDTVDKQSCNKCI